MHEPRFVPSLPHRERLDAATPRPGDWTLYCPKCEFVGQTNAAYAASFMADHNPSCDGHLRLWKHSL